MIKITTQPISNVEWRDVRELSANDYNPNVVLNQELKLLEFSILENGWIQPLLITKNNIIIDGFHRYWLSNNSKLLIKSFKYLAPCAVLDLDEAQRMLLTVRINRAKGNHIAAKMHELISKLFEMGISKLDIAKSIGASEKEINLLLQENVFTKLDIKNHKYSKAWEPTK
jgi:ParB-like chromosome segregation protein Spo0J